MADANVDPGLERAIARSNVNPADEPSVGWGWHGEAPKAFQIVGWLFTILVFAYLIGNHDGNVENMWIIGVGLALVFLLVRYNISTRKERKRRI
ncbi:DUF2631 domain-containing protein [Hoyosella subflava]|uniref:DUF2631 domain-containing protein n=1 Tax=Hoyosella subflava (strain DSM 45089 / JCM 17490 / NBRC 109087 / DQS3-9A1) TaxID=443218 RepID=F6EIX7_HOYSD|nr:DUF2631 domain-containing protein [Hoyosella subflava]AEF40038.1 hypothetical protein AS9A_1589 [Hoyosella subflava DQS3-9A1]